jgi:hypothetical protein
MITEFTRNAAPLQDAFYALSLAKPAPDAEVLDELVRLYPEFGAQLTEMAVELALDALAGEEEDDSAISTAEVNDLVLKAMSRFHNRLHTVKAETARAKAQLEPVNPFAALSTAEMRALGQRLNANTVFALKLRDRLIDETTMTEGFKRRVAEELTVPFELVAAHFASRPAVGAHAHFKADQKPEAVRKQSFEEAVRSSGLDEEQQRYLLSL